MELVVDSSTETVVVDCVDGVVIASHWMFAAFSRSTSLKLKISQDKNIFFFSLFMVNKDSCDILIIETKS